MVLSCFFEGNHDRFAVDAVPARVPLASARRDIGHEPGVPDCPDCPRRKPQSRRQPRRAAPRMLRPVAKAFSDLARSDPVEPEPERRPTFLILTSPGEIPSRCDG